MYRMVSTTWEPTSGIEGPCADVSVTLSRDNSVEVVMHFSLVAGLPNRDLRLQFARALALHWEDECPGLYPAPSNMAKCRGPQWDRWVFPLQRVEGSELLEQIRAVHEGSGPRLSHYLLISMNHLLHIVSSDESHATWIPGIADEA
jgi:hypothetical protein